MGNSPRRLVLTASAVALAAAFVALPSGTAGAAQNILHADTDFVGVGVAYAGNTVYVAEEFMAAP